MKITLPVLFFCINLVCLGQEQPLSGKGWMLGVGFSPDIAYRTLIGHEAPYSSMAISSRNRTERPRLAYSAGLYANYFFNDRLGIGTGLVYSLKGQDVHRQRVEGHEWDCFPFTPYYYTGTEGSEYLDVPITAIIMIGKGRLRSITNIGLAGNFYLGGRNGYRFEYDDGMIHKGYDSHKALFSSIDLSGVISTGVSYRLNNKLDLRLEPNFRHGLINSGIPSYYTSLFWNAGINVSAFLDLR